MLDSCNTSTSSPASRLSQRMGHAWSNNEELPPDNPDDPYWVSARIRLQPVLCPGEAGGVSTEATWKLPRSCWASIPPPAAQLDTIITVYRVVWGDSIRIYNAYREGTLVWARSRVVTHTNIFLRSVTLWRYKHNDAYWDTRVKLLVCE